MWQTADRLWVGPVETSTVLDAPALLFPAELDVGTQWVRSFEGSTTDDTGTTPMAFDAPIRVTEAAEIDVAAGTFDALRLEVDLPAGQDVWWLAPGVGIVLQEGFGELVAID